MNNQLVPSSSSSSSSFCIDSTPSWRYDVFLSFRGEDTRTNFTDHLYKALDNNGIYTFIDRQLVRGEEISPALLQAIEESRISLVIFSKTYAASRWCLDELVKIFQCRQSKQQIVLPVFYKVDPSHVRNQTSSFGDEFKKLECKFEDNKEKILAWRSALREAANLSGHPVKEGDYEATSISNIVEDILIKVLDGTYLDVAKYPVGIQSCVQEVKDLVGVDGNGRRVVGIWGTSGIGKTTIARAVYNAIARKFEGSCFLADVRETLTSREGLIQLQKTLLSKTLRGTKWEIVNVHEGISLIKNRLRQKKILLILDDVDQLEQLKSWVDVDCFGEGSRVIITTKDRGLLDFYGGQWIYEVKKLSVDKALELFSWNAFERNRPPDDYLSLARRAIAYAQGLPLALNIIGSHLRNKCIDRWQAILDGYDSYDGEPYTIIEKILRKTYDAWDYGLQQVFLDIACFFNGENKDYVIEVLSSSTLNVREDIIDVLVEKAIITIERDLILMHDLLQKMGKQIVYDESPTEPGKRSRVWDHKDVYHVLTENQGTETIRSIVVELPKSDKITLNPESFLRMVKLEIFINRNAEFSGYVDYLPNSLRWIELRGRSLGGQVVFNIKHTVELNLSSNFHPRNVVCFDVPHSGIRQLKGFKNSKLTQMRLNGCKFLEKLPDLSGSPNIRVLDLSGCTSLVEVDDSVGFLDKLVVLELSGCSKLTRFPTRLRSRSLHTLSLTGCTTLKSFPEGMMETLWRLDIEKSGIRELPSIAYFPQLQRLNAGDSDLQNIQLLAFGKKVKFDEVSSCSSNLQLSLNLAGCNLSESDFLVPLHYWSALIFLNLSRNNFVSLPDCISKAVNLESLRLECCKRLREILVLPPKLKSLCLGCCTSLEKISKLPPRLEMLDLGYCSGLSGDEVAKLENNWLNEEIDPHSQSNIIYALKSLYLAGTNFVSLPDFISKAVNLERLHLFDCKRLREIPVLPPKLRCLFLKGCTSLEKIPKLPPRLGILDLCNCSGLSGDEVAKLENNLLNEGIYPGRKLSIIYPGNEVPKWFSYISNHPTTIQPLSEYERDEDDWEDEFVGGSEFRFEIPLKLQVEETLLGLALSSVVEPCSFGPDDDQCIFINGKMFDLAACCTTDIKATHVNLALVGLGKQEQQGDICEVVFRFRNGCPIKSCGVHCLLRNQDSGSSSSEDEEQQRLRQQQQILQSMPQLQRAQLQQQQQKQQQFQQPMQPVSSIKRPYGGGVFARRLMEYLYHQRQRPADNSIAYWRKFVTEYYSPRAKKRWCLSLYDNVGHHAPGVFPQAAMDAWQCDICGSKSGRGFEATFEVLPTLNEIKFGSGLIDELFNLDLARECRSPSGVMMLEYGKAVQESVYEQLRVVWEGQLRIIFTQDLKILSWEFCARQHEELLPRRLVAPQVNQLVQVAHKCQSTIAESGSDGISQQDLQTNSNMVPTAGRQLAKSLELQSLKDLGQQKMQEMELIASAQGLPTDRNTLNKLMALHPGLNNQMNNHHQMVGRGAMSGAAQAAYQNLLLRHNPMNSNANSLQQEASSSFNNSNHSPSSTFQGAAALIPGSMHNLPGSALSSPHLPSRQPQQLQQRSLSSNSLLQQTHSTGSQGNQALQQQMIQQLLQEMSNDSGGGQQSLPCPSANGSVGRNGVSFGGNNPAAAPSTSYVPGSHGPAPSRNNSFKTPANSDNSTGGGGNNTYNQRAPYLPSNLHLQEDLVQDIAREFTEKGFFNSNPDDNMYGWKA